MAAIVDGLSENAVRFSFCVVLALGQEQDDWATVTKKMCAEVAGLKGDKLDSAIAECLGAGTVMRRKKGNSYEYAWRTEEQEEKERTRDTETGKFYVALCHIMRFDPKIRSEETSGRVNRLSASIREAGYTLDDLRDFWKYWYTEKKYTYAPRDQTLTQFLYDKKEHKLPAFMKDWGDDGKASAMPSGFAVYAG